MQNHLLESLNKQARYKSKFYITMMAINIALSSFFFGYTNNYFGTIDIHTMMDVYQIPLQPASASGIINGLVPLCTMFGSLATNFIINKYSRRQIILINNAFACIAGIILFIEYYPFLFIGRMMQGIAAGSYAVIAQLMIRQIAPTQIAGLIGSLHFAFFLTGVSFACLYQYILSLVFNDPKGEIIWRYVFAFPFVSLSIQTFNLIFVFPYETPKYYLSIGQTEKARQFIELIYKERYVEQVQLEKIQDLRHKKINDQQIKKNKQKASSTQFEKITSINKNAVFIGFYVATMHQLSCISPLSIYTRQIVNGSLENVMAIAPTIFNTLQLVGIIAFVNYFHIYGRKVLLVNGSLIIGCALFFISMGLIIKTFSINVGTFIAIISLSSLGLGFGMTYAPTTLLYISEIVDPQLFSKAVFVNRLSAWLLVTLFPILTTNFFGGHPQPLLLIFSGLMIYSYFFFEKYLIETKNKQEKDIRIQLKNLKLFK